MLLRRTQHLRKDVPSLNFDRAASEFEALRLETEASGKRPKAFMLTIGNLAMRQHVPNTLVTSWPVPDMKLLTTSVSRP